MSEDWSNGMGCVERTPSIEDVAKFLANEYACENWDIKTVWWAPHQTEVRLVVVSSDMDSHGEVLPFRMRADPPDIPYNYVVVHLSDDDWFRRHELEWPSGLKGTLRRVYPPVERTDVLPTVFPREVGEISVPFKFEAELPDGRLWGFRTK